MEMETGNTNNTLSNMISPNGSPACGESSDPNDQHQQQRDLASKKWRRVAQEHPIKCEVCQRDCHYTYYGVRCCEGCKQFFRRTVIKQKYWWCNRKGNCVVSPENLHCRSCRFDTCLRVGMQWRNVSVHSTAEAAQFVRELCKRRQKLLNKHTAVIKKETCELDGSNGKVLSCASSSIDESVVSPNGGSEEEMLARIFLCEDPFEESAVDIAHGLLAAKQRGDVATVGRPLGGDKCAQIGQALGALLAVERNIQDFFATARTYNDNFVDQFGSLEDLVRYNRSIITQFKESVPLPFDDSNPVFVHKNVLLLMDLVSFVDLFRSMPIFALLDLDDQVCLVRHLALPLLGFSERYHSAKWNSEVVVKMSSGYSPLRRFYDPHSERADDKMLYFAELLFRRSMRPFNRVSLSLEEFLLLRALIMNHSAVDGLSAHARQLVRAEAERYASILMGHVQARLGPLGGVQRYAELLLLVESVFRVARKHGQLHTHLEHKFGLFSARLPGGFLPMCLGQGSAAAAD